MTVYPKNAITKFRRVTASLLAVVAVVLFTPSAHCQTTGSLSSTVKDTNYLSKAWRDSVIGYSGRVAIYQQELLSYDFGMSFSMLPVAGEWYVNRTSAGINFTIGRALAVGTAGFGLVRLVIGSPHPALNWGFFLGGIVAWFGLKLWEISDVQHQVSHNNEHWAETLHIALPDVTPGSIRYPVHSWPSWVTQGPSPRHSQDARAAVDAPIPVIR